MATMKDIIQSPLLLALVIGGLLYISAFSLVYLKKAYDHCLELGITRKELSNVIKSSLIFSVVPSLSIVVGLFVLIAVLGYASSAEMLESATGRQFGVFMLVMFSVYIPILLFTDNVQAAVMITGLVIAIGVGVLAKRPGLAWLNNFVMAFSMLGGLISSLAWVRIFG